MKIGLRGLIGLFWLAYFGSATAQELTVAQQYSRNRAGVVMIRTDISATVNVSQVTINNLAFNRLLDSIQRITPDSGRLSSEQQLDIVLREFNNKAKSYFKSTFNYFRHQQKISARATGFIITGDGYVVTNCHVVDEDDAYIKRRFILSAFREITETNIKAIESAWAVKFSDQQRSTLFRTFANVYSQIMPITLENLKKDVFVLVTEEKKNPGTIIKDIPAEIKVMGQSMPGKDLAILKMNGDKEFPTIMISSSDEIQVGREVYVYGFPAAVTNNEFLSDQTVLEPTLTKGIISALKKSIKGWPLIQMDANINHGNSGGPVCNEKGEVIGITTFGSLEDNARTLAPGLNFAIPTLVLREFLLEAEVKPHQSKATLEFNKAIGFFEKAYYSRALGRFKKLSKSNPGYPGIYDYINRSEQYINDGKDQRPGVVAWISVFSIIIIGAGYFFFVYGEREG